MKKVVILLTFIYSYGILTSQQEVLPISNSIENSFAKAINTASTNSHTVIQPYNLYKLREAEIDFDSVLTNTHLDKIKKQYRNGSKKFFISPIGEGNYGINTSTGSINYLGAIGAQLQYNFSSKLGIELNYKYFITEQEKYIDTNLFTKSTIPSIGRKGLIPEQNNGVNDIQGHIVYTPNHFFSFMLGKGNHFWGDGYRSFLLSDNASSYPFLRIESTFWNVKYTNLYSWHSDITTGNNRNKFSASHHLSWNITEDINLGLFETVIWAGEDSLIDRGFDVNYINPIIFYRPVEYAQGSNDNSLLGLNLKGKIKKNHILYGQLLLDEFLLAEIRSDQNWWGNKYSIQLGYKNYQLFNNPNLSFLIERNISRPFTFSHITSTLNYGHLNQSLAHPLGANFKETLEMISFKHKKWTFKQQANLISYGADSISTNNGGNIFLGYQSRKGEYGHKILQGEKHNIFYNELSASYKLVDAINLNAFATAIIRSENTPYNNSTDLFIKIGVRTQLWNSYKDF